MKTFEQLYSGYFGETIDNVNQIAHHNFTGQELKDFVIECQSQCLQQALERIENKNNPIKMPYDDVKLGIKVGLDSAVTTIRQLLKELEWTEK